MPWAAVALADKLDTVVGMFVAGERPTGSRDPYGIRRAAQGIVRILADLPALTGLDVVIPLGRWSSARWRSFRRPPARPRPSRRSGRSSAIASGACSSSAAPTSATSAPSPAPARCQAIAPLTVRRRLDVLPEFTDSADFATSPASSSASATSRATSTPPSSKPPSAAAAPLEGLAEPAELALRDEIVRRSPVIQGAVAQGDGYRKAFAEAAGLRARRRQFFDDVMVMADDPALRAARLRLMRRLESLILQLADISEMVPQSES